MPESTEVLVVGGGPAGAATAVWAARAGYDTVLVDSARFPRDKTCGDGLTPRAVGELERLGLADWLRGRTTSRGLRLHGFGGHVEVAWPLGEFPSWGSAVPRGEFDHRLFTLAGEAGAVTADGVRAVDVTRSGDRVESVTVDTPDGPRTIACRHLVVADGVRSPLGRALGREWHRDSAFGVAARSYVDSARADEQWITSHLELRDADGALRPGYGWVFPLGGDHGGVNLGVGTLATAKRPASGSLRPLLAEYARQRTVEWGLGEPRRVASALLPMGGAVSHIAGDNWALVGDAAACVNPLNGEGIDYGLEGARWVVDLIGSEGSLRSWPHLLRARYGPAFSAARQLAELMTVPGVLPALGPIGLRSRVLMTVAVRMMGNLVTDDDTDFVGRAWRAAGRAGVRIDRRPLFV